MALKIKSVLSGKKYQNIILLIIVLLGLAISLIIVSNYCHSITPFIEIMLVAENYYFNMIGIIIIILTIKIITDKVIGLVKHSVEGKNCAAIKHGRDYAGIIFLFLLSALMYMLSTPICPNSLIYS